MKCHRCGRRCKQDRSELCPSCEDDRRERIKRDIVDLIDIAKRHTPPGEEYGRMIKTAGRIVIAI